MKNKITKQIKQILSNRSLIENIKHVMKAFGFSLVIILCVVILTNLLYQEKVFLKRGYEVIIVKNDPQKIVKDVSDG